MGRWTSATLGLLVALAACGDDDSGPGAEPDGSAEAGSDGSAADGAVDAAADGASDAATDATSDAEPDAADGQVDGGDAGPDGDVIECMGSELLCAVSCVLPESSHAHCGAAEPCDDNPGERCRVGEECVSGNCACIGDCNDGNACTVDSCNGDDRCDHICRATPDHVDDFDCAACSIRSCAAGFTDRNGDLSDGCEEDIDLYVDASNAGDSAEDGSALHPFDSLAEALSAAGPGQTIRIEACAYAGGLTIDVPGLELDGAGADEVTVQIGLGQDVLTIETSEVVVRGLTVQGGRRGLVVDRGDGGTAFGVRLHDVAVRDLHGVDPADDVIGVHAYRTDGLIVDGLDVTDLAAEAAPAVAIADGATGGGAVGLQVMESAAAQLRNLTLGNMVGGAGGPPNIGDGGVGGPAIAVQVTNSSCEITGSSIHDLTGGIGGEPNIGSGGEGGSAVAFLLRDANCTIVDATISELIGGAGGVGFGSSVSGGTGGTGAAAELLGSSDATLRELRALNLHGGMGGDGSGAGATGGGGGLAAGILVTDVSTARIRNTLLARFEGGTGSVSEPGPGGDAAGVVVLGGASGDVQQLTVYGVRGGFAGSGALPAGSSWGAAALAGAASLTVENTVISRTDTACLFNEESNGPGILTAAFVIAHRCGDGVSENATTSDLLEVDPLFRDLDRDDFHLGPRSPGIDSGDPAADCGTEAAPNGCRVNMGRYGNTLGASARAGASHCDSCP